jgi:hypothetical protein
MMSDSQSGFSSKVCGIAVLWLAVLTLHEQVFAQEKNVAPSDSVLRRYLLVASEGLYVVEPDGSCSWSYNPQPYKGQGWVAYDDLVYDGWALPNNRFLYATHRYVREVDQDKKTIWEYRVEGTTEVKACVPLANGRVAVLNSQEQAILELESGSGRILDRIPVPAKGTDHTRYNALRMTPDGHYLVALRAEERFVEISRAGNELLSFPVSGLPVMAQRLSNGDTLCTGEFGLVRFDKAGKNVWSFTREDAAPHFPLIYAAGVFELPSKQLLVANSDWHFMEKDQNRVQSFVINTEKNIQWTLPASAFGSWKRSETEPRTGFLEHRVCLVQPLP